jgi:hypothetical protein
MSTAYILTAIDPGLGISAKRGLSGLASTLGVESGHLANVRRPMVDGADELTLRDTSPAAFEIPAIANRVGGGNHDLLGAARLDD